jgi:GDP-4-dehydro-6-deoxy-D-mannose reductase
MPTKRHNAKRVFITGMGGSGGSYLAEYIVNNHPDVEVHGTARWHSTTAQDNLVEIRDRIHVHDLDMTDLAGTYSVIRDIDADTIFHLAANANVRGSFSNPVAVLDNNIRGTVNLFEAVRMTGQDPVIQLCSTSEVYGQVRPEDIPISEETPFRPASPYGVSKVAQDLLGRTYWVSYDMQIITTRMFTYLNPRRADLFATSFARQVARIEAGLQNELKHGNLDSVRTIIDVRDAMRSYWDAVIYCEPGEVYNIGGAQTMTVGEFLDLLKDLAHSDIPSSEDPALLRPADVTLQVPNIQKFKSATGWEPQYTFEQSVEHLLNHWRRHARIEVAASNTPL